MRKIMKLSLFYGFKYFPYVITYSRRYPSLIKLDFILKGCVCYSPKPGVINACSCQLNMKRIFLQIHRKRNCTCQDSGEWDYLRANGPDLFLPIFIPLHPRDLLSSLNFVKSQSTQYSLDKNAVKHYILI